MKAWICLNYGGPEVLTLETRRKPVPKDNEVLIRICATTVASGDMRVRTLKMPRGFGLIARLVFGVTRPRQPILGAELAGTVEAVGRFVTTWKPGDAVIGFPGAAMGCHAEYRVMAADKPIAPKPANLSFEEAASLCFGGTTALHFLRRAGLKAGESLLVIGASGAVGSAMVQLASHMGARVTGVTSTRNIDLVRSLGAQAVIDYTRQDFAEADETYDIVADTVGASSFAKCLPVLNEHGRYLGVSADLPGLFARPVGTKRSIAGPASERPEDVLELARLAEAGVLKPVIDRIYGFSQIADAHAHVETGHKRGSVVVSITSGS
ncbi:NADPH:quinone reductase [Azospirillum oryzae]|uniref:NADPH:quinone reductase n=1 Tax=Azospirillum oryzae TaxID=286727 RepID=A0A1X7H9Y3_9PROT|nr:NAD(P)-dependent alcohol dehydrogenase [Azospirillum oryzae]SMF81518.1 NADPH:quinone reductase [Azospirillum oryzae]